MVYFSSLLFSTFTTVMFIPILSRLSVKLNALDAPGERKIHTRPIPRCGGLAMALGGAIPVLFWAAGNEFIRAFLMATSILVIFGSIDDFRGLGYRTKFIGQVAAALIIVLYGGTAIKSLGNLLPEGVSLPAWASVLLSLVAIVGVTNAINLADGLDGLAGGISFLGFCCIGYLAYQENNPVVSLISVSLCGALFGFLRFNTYPASLFMGDTGSQLLGFSAIVLSIHLTQGETPISPLLPLIIVGFPVLDTLTVMAERVSRGRSPFSADRNHFHHRLMGFGLSHREAVFIIYLIQTLLVVSAFFIRFHSEWFLLAAYAVFSCSVIAAFHAADRGQWRFPRIPLLDSVIKGRWRSIVETGVLIRTSFRAVEFGLPALVLFTCFLPASIPLYGSIIAAAVAVCLLLICVCRSGWLKWSLPLAFYLTLPFLLYLSHTEKAGFAGGVVERMQNFAYMGLTLSLVLVIRFTRRKEGFRATPFDFLILFFVAFIVPRLPFEYPGAQALGLLSAKLLMFFFGMEVLVAELRGKLNRLGFLFLAALVIVAVRGIWALKL